MKNTLVFRVMSMAAIGAGFLCFVAATRAQEATNTPAPLPSAPPVAVTVPEIQPIAPVSQPPAGTTGGTATNSDGETISPSPDKVMIEPSETKELINVAVDNETLENVVNMFTRITGANIVATSANLDGTVTVNLKDVEWRAALSSILDLHNLALIEKMPGSRVYSIVAKPPQESEPLVVETIPLSYTTAAELKPVINSMLAAATNATIMDLASRNALIVKTTEANLREIKLLVTQLDVPSKQVCVEAKFMELDEEASRQLGIRWDSLAQFGVRLNAGPFDYNRNTTKKRDTSDSDIMKATSTDNDMTRRIYRADGTEFEEIKTEFIEAPPGSGQYIAQSTVTPTREREFGSETSQELQSSDVSSFSRTITENQAAILEMDSLNVILSALKETAGVQVISNPKIIVMSGSTNASFGVGKRFPIIKTERSTGTQNDPGSKFTATLDTSINTEFIKQGYLEEGVSLLVMPVAKTDDMIEAAIQPRLIRYLGDKEVGTGDDKNSWPIISVKEIKTRFTLRSGQTVAIGGLTGSEDKKIVTKVPLLGDIPLIGKYLFTHTEDAKAQRETIVFVTLSRAEPDQIKENEGIPGDSELVHKRMLQNKLRQEEFNEEMKNMKKASEDDRSKKVRANLMKTRK